MNKNNVELVISAGRRDQLIGDSLPQFALSGRSNVGKSSCLNRLMGRKSLARVSSSPGKTITVNYFRVDRQMYFVDLPGYGFARRAKEDAAKWRTLTDAYFQNNQNLKLVLQLIDGKTGPSADDETMLDWLSQTNTPFIIVATKWDKLNATDKKRNLSLLKEIVGEEIPVIPFSSLKNEGIAEVWQEIEKILRA